MVKIHTLSLLLLSAVFNNGFAFGLLSHSRLSVSRHYCAIASGDDASTKNNKTKISIESITNLFNQYLEEESAINTPAETIIMFKKQSKRRKPKDDDVVETTTLQQPELHYRETEIELTKINRNIKSKALLLCLKNPYINDLVKLQHIDQNKWLINASTSSTNLQNGGLMNDWNNLFE